MAEVVEKLNRADIIQQYHGNLVFYKGQPVYVREVTRDGDCFIIHLRNGEDTLVKFNLRDFKAPIARLGMLNIKKSVLYLSRIPIRRMNIGLNGENLLVNLLPVHYPEKDFYTSDAAHSLQHPSFCDMFDNKYPCLEEALKQAKNDGSACAFDKQFAVDKNGNLFYKTKKVGSAKGCTEVKDLVFDKEFSYLSLLLDGNHEKTIGIACS